MPTTFAAEYFAVHHVGPMPAGFDYNLARETVRQWHLAKGYSDIGYHKLWLPDGRVIDGRPETVIGAQAFGLNYASLGFLAVGDFRYVAPPPAMVHAMIQTLAIEAKQRHWTKRDLWRIIGHRDVPKVPGFVGKSYTTECPGDALHRLLWPEGWRRHGAKPGIIIQGVAKYLPG